MTTPIVSSLDEKTQKFVDRAVSVHGNRYDYSKSQYINSDVKICITCEKHGDFWQLPLAHVGNQKQGCPSCSNRNLTTEKYIALSIEKYGNRFDYSKTVYTGMARKVIVSCKEHGEFSVAAREHLHDRENGGCKFCNGARFNEAMFIEKVKSIHGEDSFSFEKLNFTNVHQKVTVTCKRCNRELNFVARKLLEGHGCKSCANDKKRLTADHFKSRAYLIHGGKYDYSRVDYRNNHTSVQIVCPEHGVFLQNPQDHLAGSGCVKCKSSIGEKTIDIALKNIGVDFERQKRFETCRHKKPLAFDFYIDNLNCAIEFQGKQHYEEIAFWHKGKQSFVVQQKKDSIKREWCNKNGVKLIEIRYDNPDIESYLASEIEKIKSL